MASQMARLAAMVAMKMQVKRTHRIRILDGALTAGANVAVNLLTCDDDPDYDLATDGSNVAECQPGARIVAVQLVLSIYGVDSGEIVEWIIGRDPDAIITGPNFSMSNLYLQDVTSTTNFLRKNTWGAGHMISTTGRDLATQHVNISGKALKRSRLMAENDVIRLGLLSSADDVSGKYYLRGRIITRGP